MISSGKFRILALVFTVVPSQYVSAYASPNWHRQLLTSSQTNWCV